MMNTLYNCFYFAHQYIKTHWTKDILQVNFKMKFKKIKDIINNISLNLYIFKK